jgi:hypothetical protein
LAQVYHQVTVLSGATEETIVTRTRKITHARDSFCNLQASALGPSMNLMKGHMGLDPKHRLITICTCKRHFKQYPVLSKLVPQLRSSPHSGQPSIFLGSRAEVVFNSEPNINNES